MKTDLFGRSEEQLRADIATAERIYRIAAGYTGGEGLAISLAIKKRKIELDRRLLAELRGESREQTVQLLSGVALAKWRANILRMGKR